MAKRNSKPEPRSAQRKTFPCRKLKVREGYYSYHNTPSARSIHSYKAPRAVPWIEIKGYWLNDAGFQIDSPLELHIVQKGWIILRVVKPSPD